MLIISRNIRIPGSELEERFMRSSGPGGQNVNKVETAVQLRFDVQASGALPEEVKERLMAVARQKMTEDGVILIEARRYRTRERNRQDARDRLAALIRRAMVQPKKRKPTRPTVASRGKRLEEKKRRGEIKRLRSGPGMSGD